MTDNGTAMLAEETREGLARLGISHETTLPYSAYQNGKQEVFWGQLEGRLLELLREVNPLRLGFLNTTSQAWVEQDYHRRPHSEIGCSPLERLLAELNVSRPAPDLETLKLAFTRQVTHRQRRSDATVTEDGVRFEVPSHFRHLPCLTLRYASWDLNRLVLVDSDRDTLLAQVLPQNKEHNASGRRRGLEPVVTLPTPAPAPAEEMPALLRQWLADYAATGRPPAYLPVTEDSHER